MYWHWQNLNDKKDGTQRSGLRHGRCWWHFDNGKRPNAVIRLCWYFLRGFCGIQIDWDDEDVTLMLAFPPVAIWLSFTSEWGIFKRLLPHKVLSPHYPDTIVIDEREIGVRIHSGRLWIQPYCKSNETCHADPWWVRGVSFNLNPFELVHIRHDVRTACGTWNPYVGSWERHKQADGRETMEYPYRYVLRDGTVQERTATAYVDRMEWRPRILRWTRLFRKVRTCIDVQFNEEVGERTGSWKGGCVGCSYELRPSETPEQCLRRMEQERVFA